MGRPINKRNFSTTIETGINMIVKLPGNEPELLPVTKQSGSRKYRVIKNGELHSVWLVPKTEAAELNDYEAMVLVTVESGERFPINKITQHLITIVKDGLLVSKWTRYNDNQSNIAKISDIDFLPIPDASEPGEPVEPEEPAVFLVSNIIGVDADYPDIETALADPAVPDNATLRLMGEYTYSSTLVIDRPVTITSDFPEMAVIQTSGSNTDPVTVVSVAANDVKLDKISIKQNRTLDTSVENALSAMGNHTGLEVTGCVIEYMEFGVSLRGSDWSFRNNEFVYTGAASNTRRAMGIYRIDGDCEIIGNKFINELSGNLRAINILQSSGANPLETISGNLKIYANSQVGNLQQFYVQENFNGAAGSFNLDLQANLVNETSGFVILFDTTANFGDVFGTVTAISNSLSNIHSGGGKGIIAVDGSGTFRSPPLTVSVSGNILTNTTFRSDFTEANGSTGSAVGFKNTTFVGVDVVLI